MRPPEWLPHEGKKQCCVRTLETTLSTVNALVDEFCSGDRSQDDLRAFLQEAAPSDPDTSNMAVSAEDVSALASTVPGEADEMHDGLKVVHALESGKYTVQVREWVYMLLAAGVSTRKCGTLLAAILEGMGMKLSTVPSKDFVSKTAAPQLRSLAQVRTQHDIQHAHTHTHTI